MWKGNYINGNRNGYWEEYHSNGNLWMKGNIKNGKLHELK
jgi:antitoxin component YwqK of YwqJK toxin-antitoxin module